MAATSARSPAPNFLENGCFPGIRQTPDRNNAYSFAVPAARQSAHGVQDAISAALRILDTEIPSADGRRSCRSFRRRTA